MTVRYVGIGGNDGNDGLSWANRKLTLNGVEDTPVQAGDIVYVGPGVYRELLTCDVAGSSGSPITYIGDITGEHTDGVGGLVRITGSDDDLSATRANCITGTSKHYRTFQGFMLDTVTAIGIAIITSAYWIVQDCTIQGTGTNGIEISGASGTNNNTIRRCLVWGGKTGANNGAIYIANNNTTADNQAIAIENCVLISPVNCGVYVKRIGGVTIRNCFISAAQGFRLDVSVGAGNLNVYNSIFYNCGTAMNSASTSYVTEDYNSLYNNATDRTNVTAGAHSIAYPPLLYLPLLLAGYRLPQPLLGELTPWSALRMIAGTDMSADDMFGITRPATDSKKSWGVVQYRPISRESTTIHAGSASLKLSDAGEVQFIVPVTAVQTTISVYAYREADYAGTNPRMVISQPGQSDRTTTDAGSASTWNQLSDTFTPAASPPYVVVRLQSLNTATSGNYDTFFDTMAVS